MTDAVKTLAPDYLSLTPSAQDKVKSLLPEALAQNSAHTGLRLAIQGGGCSGLSYKTSFDARQPNDYTLALDGFEIYVDPKSAIYLKGITLDYQSGLEGKGFVFQNPNATSTCGCGESFSL